MVRKLHPSIVMLAAAALAFSGLVAASQPASASDGLSVDVRDSAGAVEDPTLGGAFVTVVATANVDTDGDSVEDVTVGGVVAGGTTVEGATLVLRLTSGSLLPDATYKLIVSKPGYSVATTQAVVTNGSATVSVLLSANANKMDFVNAFGAQMTAVVADGQPCVFYGTTSSVPSLYRTTDCAGSWAPVTLARDEKSNDSDGLVGMDGSQAANSVTTSGFPGEVAAIVGSNVWFSRDFGTTWLSFTKPNGMISTMKWVHAYDATADKHSSYMFFVMGDNGSSEIKVVGMPAGQAGTVIDPNNDPAANSYTATSLTGAKSFKGAAGDLVAFAAGASNVFVAVQRGGSGAKVFKIDSGTAPSAIDASATTSTTIAGLTRDTSGTTTDLLLFGGATNSSDGSPRSLVVWDRFDDGTAKSRAATESTDGTWTASDGTIYGASSSGAPESFTSVGGPTTPGSRKPTCGENNTPPVGSIAPVVAGEADATNWSNVGTLAMARSCIVMHVMSTRTILGTSIPAGAVLILDVPGANNNTGSAFSAGFDLANDSVVLSGDGARGLVKAATFKSGGGGPAPSVKVLGSYNYRPLFPEAAHVADNYLNNRAEPGRGETSGGFAVNGITSPTVKDVATNPLDADGLYMGFSFTGGGRTVMSTNGGKSFFTIGGGGSNAVTWWVDGDGNYWIAGGSSGNANSFFSARQFTKSQYATIKADVDAGLDPDSLDYDPSKRLTFGMPFKSGDPNNGFGSKSFGLGDMQAELTGLVGVNGTKKVIVSASRNSSASGIAIATLTGTGQNVDFDGNVKYLKNDGTFGTTASDGGAFSNVRVTSIQYCPLGSADAVADKAFIALADEQGSGTGSVRMISGVSTENPVASNPYVAGLDLAGADNLRDLKVECDTGAILIGARASGNVGGGGGGQPSPKMFISLDGAAHFFDITPASTVGLPPQITNVETVAIETSPTGDGVSQVVAVSNSGDVIAIDFDLKPILQDANLTLVDLKDGQPDAALGSIPDQTGTAVPINNAASPDGFAFGSESPGDIEIPATAAEIVTGNTPMGLRFGPRAIEPDPVPMLGSGAGALATKTTDDAPPTPTTYTVTFNANGGSGMMAPQTASAATNLTANAFTRASFTFTGWNTLQNGQGTPYANLASYPFTADVTLFAQWQAVPQPVSSTITVTGWDQGVAKALKYNAKLTVAVTSNAGAVTVTGDAKCTVAGLQITAVAGSGTCVISFSTAAVSNVYLQTTVTRTINLSAATVAAPKVTAPKYGKTVKLTASTKVGTKTVAFVWATTTPKICSISKGVLKGVKKGSCKITVTAKAVSGYTAALAKTTLSLTIK